VAGPWFTVQESSDEWKEISQIWISNGKDDCKGRIEVRIRLTAETVQNTTVRHRDVPRLHDQGATY